MFLGRAGTFPNEALKIAAAGSKATPNQFDPVEEKAGALQDWFALKGFDNFQVPEPLANLEVVGVSLFTVENEPVAQVLVPENVMYIYSFASQPFGINIVPEKSWRITEADRSVLAIREEKGMCFLISFRGSKQDMKNLLKSTEHCIERTPLGVSSASAAVCVAKLPEGRLAGRGSSSASCEGRARRRKHRRSVGVMNLHWRSV
jgi:hypothetical protein